jgi:hypothetical protein
MIGHAMTHEHADPNESKLYGPRWRCVQQSVSSAVTKTLDDEGRELDGQSEKNS